MASGKILAAAAGLGSGEVTSAELVETALARATDPSGEGQRVFTRLYAEESRIAADASDRLRQVGIVPSVLAGLPISIKDLFDVRGETTLAGSIALDDAPPAQADAKIVSRLRAAGAIIVGKTNMTEFAYSGLGLNPHYGTPRNPYDRANGRIPGGSSSGAAISVTDNMALAAIGTDTGGSIRIPAALTGLAGFKPTQYRVPLDGAFPLSKNLDSIGPLADSVSSCAILDSILAGEAPSVPTAIPIAGLRLAVPQHCVLDKLDDAVARAFARTLDRLSTAGARIVEIPFAELDELNVVNAAGGFSAAEAYALHRKLIARRADAYDPRVIVRIRRGEKINAADYVDLLHARQNLIARAAAITAPFDAIVMPTVPMVAPYLHALEADDAAYAAANILMLRNPSISNFLDRCALTLPCHQAGKAPVGFMLMGEHGADRWLLAIGLSVEACLDGTPQR